ncbi:aldo-keto reductase-like protein [Nadsonia fulvescens var. elongata DSM 6958]|uniref:Aldo-keto reductase-like protein n=1 Tax=Nadsonia fulvescens var. elongata DSM 6958 TaxID=857566 RepID=A0A1E3PE97_9ASCO|nr:aldo-keto reductase-like protein [Nadsonia fulvescens var. elongata DSM 6958]
MIPTVALNTSAHIPQIGLGTFQSESGKIADAVYTAIVKAGIRHIDCAWIYGNEVEVGQGIARAISSGEVSRSDLFITSKLWCVHHRNAPKALQSSLDNLGLDYLDLYLMHWPVPLNPEGNDPNTPTLPDGSRDVDKNWDYLKTWRAMESLVKDTPKKVKAIGVSNFSVAFLQDLLKLDNVIVPAMNQVELHPLLPQDELVDFCLSKGIQLTAYSPFGSNGAPLLNLKGVKKVAEKHGVEAGNVLINYHVKRGYCVIPKSVTESRITKNTLLVNLDEEDLAELKKIPQEEGFKRFVKPNWGVDLKFLFWR